VNDERDGQLIADAIGIIARWSIATITVILAI
jgi:hypothetical protein